MDDGLRQLIFGFCKPAGWLSTLHKVFLDESARPLITSINGFFSVLDDRFKGKTVVWQRVCMLHSNRARNPNPTKPKENGMSRKHAQS